MELSSMEQMMDNTRTLDDRMYVKDTNGNTPMLLQRVQAIYTDSKIWTAEFSQDGSYLAVGCANGDVIVFIVGGSVPDILRREKRARGNRNQQILGMLEGQHQAPMSSPEDMVP